MSRNEAWQVSGFTVMTCRPTSRVLLILILLSLAGCTTTSLVRVKDEAIGRPRYARIVVSTPTEDLQVRDYVEGLLAHRLRSENVTAYRAMDVLPPLREYTPEEVADRLEAVGAALLLVVAVTDFWQTHYTTPSRTVERTTSHSSTTISQWGGLLSASAVGSSTTVSKTIPGTTFTQSNVKLDVRVFVVDLNTVPTMIWRANSTTSGDFFVGASKVMRDAAQKIADRLVADAILRAGSRLSGITILGGPNHDIVLGSLCDWQPGKGSLFERSGRYGKGAKHSVWHRESIYASDTSECSVCNIGATNPPIIVDEDGKVIGRLSISTSYDIGIGYASERVRRRIAREICER